MVHVNKIDLNDVVHVHNERVIVTGFLVLLDKKIIQIEPFRIHLSLCTLTHSDGVKCPTQRHTYTHSHEDTSKYEEKTILFRIQPIKYSTSHHVVLREVSHYRMYLIMTPKKVIYRYSTVLILDSPLYLSRALCKTDLTLIRHHAIYYSFALYMWLLVVHCIQGHFC